MMLVQAFVGKSRGVEEAEERPICEVLVGTVDPAHLKIDILTSIDAYRIPRCAPPALLTRSQLTSVRSCRIASSLLVRVAVSTSVSLLRTNSGVPFAVMNAKMREGQPKFDVEAEMMRNIEDLPTRELLLFRVLQDSSIWVVNQGGKPSPG